MKNNLFSPNIPQKKKKIYFSISFFWGLGILAGSTKRLNFGQKTSNLTIFSFEGGKHLGTSWEFGSGSSTWGISSQKNTKFAMGGRSEKGHCLLPVPLETSQLLGCCLKLPPPPALPSPGCQSPQNPKYSPKRPFPPPFSASACAPRAERRGKGCGGRLALSLQSIIFISCCN